MQVVQVVNAQMRSSLRTRWRSCCELRAHLSSDRRSTRSVGRCRADRSARSSCSSACLRTSPPRRLKQVSLSFFIKSHFILYFPNCSFSKVTFGLNLIVIHQDYDCYLIFTNFLRSRPNYILDNIFPILNLIFSLSSLIKAQPNK